MQAHIASQSYGVSNAYRPQRFVGSLSHCLQQLGSTLIWMLAPQDSLYVQTRERKGQTVWIVRDRVTGTCDEFISEAKLRIWLEERYSQ